MLGRALSRDRIRLYNAACAISFLAFRAFSPSFAPADARWPKICVGSVARLPGYSTRCRRSRNHGGGRPGVARGCIN